MGADVQALYRRDESLKQERQGWERAYEELATHFLPTRFRHDWDTEGSKKPVLNGSLVDTTGVRCVVTLAAGMQGGMTSPARRWFELALQGDDEQTSHEAGVWLDEVRRRMETALHKSNFYNAVHTLYADLGTFGTACLIETADENGLRFDVLRAGEYAVDIGADNTVDTLFRHVQMTARQLQQQFGEESLPDAVRRCLTAGNCGEMTQRFSVIHAIYPRKDIKGTDRATDMPWASVYFMGGGQGGKPALLRESGFKSFPAFVPRWNVAGTDIYGISPAMYTLADCKMLQSMSRTLIRTMHKIADPPLSVNAAIRGKDIDLRPGGQNFVDWQGGGSVVAASPIAQPDAASVKAALEAREDTRHSIEEGMYSDLFKMLISSDRRQQTATEVEAKEQEKMVLIGPVVERLQSELFRPLIERTFELMQEWNYLPPAPDDMQGMPIRVDFVSILAQAQRLTSTSPVDQLLSFVSIGGQAMPEMLDNLDPDKTVEAYADALAVDSSCLRSPEARDAVRQQRAAAMQQQQEMAQGAQQVQDIAGLAGAAKALGQTPVGADGQTAAQALMGGMGGI